MNKKYTTWGKKTNVTKNYKTYIKTVESIE